MNFNFNPTQIDIEINGTIVGHLKEYKFPKRKGLRSIWELYSLDGKVLCGFSSLNTAMEETWILKNHLLKESNTPNQLQFK